MIKKKQKLVNRINLVLGAVGLLISVLAFLVARESNRIAQKANEIAYFSSSHIVIAQTGPEAVGIDITKCNFQGDPGIVLLFDFGITLQNRIGIDVNLIDMDLQVEGLPGVAPWRIVHYADSERKYIGEIKLSAEETQNLSFFASSIARPKSNENFDDYVETITYALDDSDPTIKTFIVTLVFDDNSKVVYQAPITYIDKTYYYESTFEEDCKTLEIRLLDELGKKNTFNPGS